MGGEMMMNTAISASADFTSPSAGEVARSAGEGAFLLAVPRKGPLTRPKTVDLSPQGEVALSRPEYRA